MCKSCSLSFYHFIIELISSILESVLMRGSCEDHMMSCDVVGELILGCGWRNWTASFVWHSSAAAVGQKEERGRERKRKRKRVIVIRVHNTSKECTLFYFQ